MTFSQMEQELKQMKATTDENLRKAIEIIDGVSFPHPDQQWAIEQLIRAAHALGLLKLRLQRQREGVGECSYGDNVKPDLSLHDKNKQETK